MQKRNLFSELVDGFQGLIGERAGELMLRKHEIEVLLPSEMPSADQMSSPMSGLPDCRNGESLQRKR